MSPVVKALGLQYGKFARNYMGNVVKIPVGTCNKTRS